MSNRVWLLVLGLAIALTVACSSSSTPDDAGGGGPGGSSDAPATMTKG